MYIGEEREPWEESSNGNRNSGTWGGVRESGSEKLKSVNSPGKIFSLKLLSNGRCRPRGVAVLAHQGLCHCKEV